MVRWVPAKSGRLTHKSTMAYDAAEARHDWTRAAIEALFELPFSELVFRAAQAHRAHFAADEVQRSQLLSVKTGGCAENCGYCSQSAHFDTGLAASKLMATADVVEAGRRAKAAGAQRFCMGAAWRDVKDRDLPQLTAMIAAVKAEGLETCATLGMLTPEQAKALRAAGLDYCNHNLDTSPEYYSSVVTTRSYQDRLDTLVHIREAGISTCWGGIVGMGETRSDRAGLLHALATLPEHPHSLPINALAPIEGAPLGKSAPIDAIERTIAVARIVCPTSMVRLSAGREAMSRETQALCFLSGANSVFVGDRLLTTSNPERDSYTRLFADLGLKPMGASRGS